VLIIEIMKNNTKELVEYLTKMGVNVTIDNNPSKEKIARIEAIIKRNRER